MSLKGHLGIEEIPGESPYTEKAEQIQVWGVEWDVVQKTSGTHGTGGVQGRAIIGDFMFSKYYDCSSPEIAKATLDGASFDEIVFTAMKTGGEGLDLDYLTITMENCAFSHYSMRHDNPDREADQMIVEKVGIVCEKFKILYIPLEGGHTAGSQYEIEFEVSRL